MQERTMVNSADRQGISFRRYALEDLQTCAKLAEDAWPPRPALATKDVVSWSMEGYIESSLMNANWTDIAYDSKGVVGFLFGRMDKYHGEAAVAGSLSGELPMLAKHIVGKYRKTPGILVFFWTLLLTELKLKINMPRSDVEIRLFIVDSEHRGKGIGGMLVDRFLHAARDVGSTLATVYTDDKMSNWQFYEKYGFRRVGAFHDNVTSYFCGVDSTGIIYVLDLKKAQATAGSEKRKRTETSSI
jgi:GNAT superfamily N-acetyltransferase